MKKILFVFMAAFLLVFTSCDKDTSDDIEKVELSDDEIAETIETSLVAEEGGVVLEIEEVVEIESTEMVSSDISNCGVSNDTTITIAGPQGQYSITSNWDWALNCTNNVPSSIVYNLTGDSNINSPRLTMAGTSVGDLTLGNLIAGDSYSLNGSIARKGTSALTSLNKTTTFTTDITFSLANLSILKSTELITGGIATISMSGDITGGNSYSRTATLTFNSDNTATLVLDSGSTYTISL